METPRDFKEIKDKLCERLIEYKTEIQAHETPIYYNPTNLHYYYPTISTLETIYIPREVITTPTPPLIFHDQKKRYWDAKIQQTYFVVTSTEEFEKTRAAHLNKLEVEFKKRRGAETPIYDMFEGGFYYPKIASEDADFVMRKVEQTIVEMFYDEEMACYFSVANGEIYWGYRSPKTFKKARQITLTEMGVDWANNPNYVPIYYETYSGK